MSKKLRAYAIAACFHHPDGGLWNNFCIVTDTNVVDAVRQAKNASLDPSTYVVTSIYSEPA